MIKGARPGAELFAVITKDDDRMRMMVGNLFQIMNRFHGIGEGDLVAECFIVRENLKQAAFIFREVVAVHFFCANAGGTEMGIVQQGVFHARVNQVGDK